MLALTIIQATVFIAYILFILYRFGILPSISHSWYKLKPLNRGYLFTFFCWSIGFIMLFYNTGKSPFFFLSGAGLIFTGAATAFKTHHSTERIVHFVGATTCVAAALMALWIDYGMWYYITFYAPIYIIFKLIKFKNYIWWVEIIAFITILIGVINHSLTL